MDTQRPMKNYPDTVWSSYVIDHKKACVGEILQIKLQFKRSITLRIVALQEKN